MDAPDAATQADLEMVAFLAIRQVPTATDRYDAETVDIRNGDNLFVVLVQDREFFHFEFEGNKKQKEVELIISNFMRKAVDRRRTVAIHQAADLGNGATSC
jgi:hypothetical protein